MRSLTPACSATTHLPASSSSEGASLEFGWQPQVALAAGGETIEAGAHRSECSALPSTPGAFGHTNPTAQGNEQWQ